MRKRLIITLFGEVQMVGFRAFAREIAAGLGLKCTATNNNDGSFTVSAEGAEDELKGFLAKILQGPPGAKITDQKIIWQ